MLLGDVPASADHARRVCEFLRDSLPPLHPLVVLQEMTFAELLQEGGSDVEAVEVLGKTIPGLEVLYGGEHEYVKRSKENLQLLIGS